MSQLRSADPNRDELQRLQALLPEALEGKVLIDITPRFLSSLIRCGENPRGWMAIEIARSRWLNLPQDQRDLLFWHQVARIQAGTAPKEGWERAALFLGLGGMVGEIWAQDGILFSLCLGLVAVSGYRLYQRQKRQAGAALIRADREALQLAIQAGYTQTAAIQSLSNALQTLKAQERSSQQQTSYQARLAALGHP